MGGGIKGGGYEGKVVTNACISVATTLDAMYRGLAVQEHHLVVILWVCTMMYHGRVGPTPRLHSNC
jgi:hypothetical protein